MTYVAFSTSVGLPPSRAAVAERCYAAGFRALAEADLGAGARLFGLLVLLEPRREQSWAGLAVAHERNGRLALAEALYAVGQRMCGASAWLELGRARALRGLGRDPEAEQAFDSAASLANDTSLERVIEEQRCLR
ncbi:MAG TPA: hypothetical protein VFU02_15935 [Polyangiaceae bacterium]|nr:hypothetical protein [Polyangiaceae bacterium]